MSKKVTTQTFLLPSASHRVKSNGTLWLNCIVELKVAKGQMYELSTQCCGRLVTFTKRSKITVNWHIPEFDC